MRSIGRRDLECPFDEQLLNGWRALHGSPVAFAFGHGLSYTTFSYEWASVPPGDLSAASLLPSAKSAALMPAALTFSVRVTNTGGLAGREVVQLYLSVPAAGEPPIALRTFGRTGLLQPGASEELQLNVSANDLSVWKGAWAPVAGTFVVHIGASSRDIRLDASFAVTA